MQRRQAASRFTKAAEHVANRPLHLSQLLMKQERKHQVCAGLA